MTSYYSSSNGGGNAYQNYQYYHQHNSNSNNNNHNTTQSSHSYQRGPPELEFSITSISEHGDYNVNDDDDNDKYHKKKARATTGFAAVWRFLSSTYDNYFSRMNDKTTIRNYEVPILMSFMGVCLLNIILTGLWLKTSSDLRYLVTSVGGKHSRTTSRALQTVQLLQEELATLQAQNLQEKQKEQDAWDAKLSSLQTDQTQYLEEIQALRNLHESPHGKVQQMVRCQQREQAFSTVADRLQESIRMDAKRQVIER